MQLGFLGLGFMEFVGFIVIVLRFSLVFARICLVLLGFGVLGSQKPPGVTLGCGGDASAGILHWCS